MEPENSSLPLRTVISLFLLVVALCWTIYDSIKNKYKSKEAAAVAPNKMRQYTRTRLLQQYEAMRRLQVFGRPTCANPIKTIDLDIADLYLKGPTDDDAFTPAKHRHDHFHEPHCSPGQYHATQQNTCVWMYFQFASNPLRTLLNSPHSSANSQACLIIYGALWAHEKDPTDFLVSSLEFANIPLSRDFYSAIVDTAISRGNLRQASEYLMRMQAGGFEPDQFVLDAMMDLYLHTKRTNQPDATTAMQASEGQATETAVGVASEGLEPPPGLMGRGKDSDQAGKSGSEGSPVANRRPADVETGAEVFGDFSDKKVGKAERVPGVKSRNLAAENSSVETHVGPETGETADGDLFDKTPMSATPTAGEIIGKYGEDDTIGTVTEGVVKNRQALPEINDLNGGWTPVKSKKHRKRQ
eukprot:Platyproteum_vivax@DN2919_c0_g1_i2.p1